MATGAPLANYLAAKRIGNFLYLSGVRAVGSATRKVVTSYNDLSPKAQIQVQMLGYPTGQMSVDIF